MAKKGKARIWTVSIECPYCGGDCIEKTSGSMNIEWESAEPIVCNDCGKEVEKPKSEQMTKSKTIKEGDLYPVWWATETRDEYGRPLAKVLAVLPYEGLYKQYFSKVLRLSAPRTKRGWLEMAVE